MKKKNKIIIVVTVFVGILIVLTLLFFYKNSNGENGIDVIKNALPFGGTPNDSNRIIPNGDVNNNNGSTSGWIGDIAKPRLFEIHKKSTAGFYSFGRDSSGKNSNIFVRDIERGIGNIFETDMSSLVENRISNITRLKIYEAIWGNSGKNVVIRYLDDKDGQTIRSFDITLLGDKPESIFGDESTSTPQKKETKGEFLPENIKEMALSQQNDKQIFYLFNLNNSAIGTVYDFDTGKKKQVFQSPFTEWLPQWPSKNIITLTTKPSEKIPGFMYFLNLKTGGLHRVLSNINGLTTLTSPDAQQILYSTSGEGWVSLNIYDVKSHSSEVLPLSTLPEKCVWSNTNKDLIYCAVPNNPQSGSYPDKWYQGRVSFSDDIWSINLKTYATEQVLSPTEVANKEFDIIKPRISKNDNFLFFINKKDLSLWGVKLKTSSDVNLD